ncbi:MAG: type II secretion system F family protein [Candidatus Dormibacteria bacterium]
MTAQSAAQLPWLEVGACLLALAAGAGGAAAVLGAPPPLPRLSGENAWVERERDLAAALGWRWRSWVAVRLSLPLAGLGAGLLLHIWVAAVIGALLGTLGFRFALAGRATRRRLDMERAFLGRLRDVRDRMAVANQPLDAALAELGTDAEAALAGIVRPLASGNPMAVNLVEVARRSRSPIVESACAVLLIARTRTLDGLIEAIDSLLLPVGAAQLAVQEETAVTLSQQRAVAVAMTALMTLMFAIVLRVDAFRAYYQSMAGNLVLVGVAAMFGGLVAILGALARPVEWTRWDLARMLRENEALGDR